MRVWRAMVLLAATGCGGAGGVDVGEASAQLSVAEQHGRDVWFKSTFGGQKLFSLILPAPPFNLPLGFDSVLTADRDTRFNSYGVLNDPDCVAGDASSGGLDRCPDDAAMATSAQGASAGVVGIRKFANPGYAPGNGQPPVLVGVTCAGCHAGLDPQHPPADPNHPAWADIHATTGGQYLEIGKIFAAHLSPHDPRYQVFRSWAPGTVDTTAIESDHINNPGIITQFFNLGRRPYFDVTADGVALPPAHRAGQGGEDDAGCTTAALRVFFNIGMCAAECMVPHLSDGPGGTQTPIDQAACAAVCPDFVQAQRDVVDLCAFMATTTPPSLAQAPGGAAYLSSDRALLARGRQVFQQNCAACHGGAVLSDDQPHPVADVGSNGCRAKTSNWEAGHIWAQFSSDQYKARGPGYYRDVPLLGVWATAPFLHTNRLGVASADPSVAGRVAAYEEAMYELLDPLSRDYLGSIQTASDSVELPGVPLPLPAGTPIALFANLDPNQPLDNLCPELVENKGHTYGWLLSPGDKHALTEWLKTQ